VSSRKDSSGLTQAADWQPLCSQAATLDPSFAPGFFYYGFDWVKVGDGRAFATGYYEPEIEGSRTPQPGYIPVYRVPADLIRCTKADGTSGRGRIDATGACVLYYSRAEIEDGALAGKGLELAWAKDPVDLFFLEIQGSGRIRFDDGTVMRIGYAGQNGRDYVAIGRLLRDRGILPPGGASMQAIKDWIRANPEQGRELMRENLSYIFFKELTGPGPLGALNVPVTAQTTVAADPNYVPLGAPIYLSRADRPEIDGIWVAQDTGGAIKGANRFDTFWGAGPEATAIAGGMSASGEALILVPKGVTARALPQP
jgi:membrane-bound lytic murein transglycosylase A